jgi:hypothetical protein
VFTAEATQVGFFGWHDHKPTFLPQVAKPASPRVLRRVTVAVSPDGKWVLGPMTTLDRGDLVLVENFR